MDLKLLAHRCRQALAARGTDAARARLAGLEGADLWAGTVQDATARGFMVALEEAISLCRPEPSPPTRPTPESTIVGKELRRRRDILVASGGARVRFSRKDGVHFIERDLGINERACLVFEDRRDLGTLDGYEPDPAERPRLLSPAYLAPASLEEAAGWTRLSLRGRLGRGSRGFPCRIAIEGDARESAVRLEIAVENRVPDHRLRIRLLGLPSEIVHAGGMPPLLEVAAHGKRFLAGTIVRACGRLAVGDRMVAVPGAQCLGWIVHELALGRLPREGSPPAA
jgi:hypothetical protein